MSANAVTLNTVANWTPTAPSGTSTGSSGAAGLNTNEIGVGKYLQALWNAGGSQGLITEFGLLANLPSFASYADAINHLGPGSYMVAFTGLQSTMTHFGDNLMSCHGTTGELSPISEQDCMWGEVSSNSERQSATTPSAGLQRKHSARPTWRAAGGGER